MATIFTSASDIVKKYNLKHVRTLNTNQHNPYTGKIAANTAADKKLYTSTLGTPVFTDLTLGVSVSRVNSGLFFDKNTVTYLDVQGNTKSYKVMTFTCVLITVDQVKNIVRTQIQGADGAIPEYIGMDDYQITINGIISGSNNHYPQTEVHDLHAINTASVAIPVTSRYLQNLDIDHIIINHFNYTQEAGGYSQQPFTINAYSAKDIDLIITTGPTGNTSVNPQNQSFN